LGAFLGRPLAAQKPGFPLQVLGSANALPVGFPLQSLARAPAAGSEIAFGNFACVTVCGFLLPQKTALVSRHGVMRNSPGKIPLGAGSACAGLEASVHACGFSNLSRVISRAGFQIRKAGALLFGQRSLETTPSKDQRILTAKSKKLNKFLFFSSFLLTFSSPLGVGSACAGLEASVHACGFGTLLGVVSRLRRARTSEF
jgi:hypothetical protein